MVSRYVKRRRKNVSHQTRSLARLQKSDIEQSGFSDERFFEAYLAGGGRARRRAETLLQVIHLGGEHSWRCAEATRGDSHTRHGHFPRLQTSMSSQHQHSVPLCSLHNLAFSSRGKSVDKWKNCSLNELIINIVTSLNLEIMLLIKIFNIN